MRWPQITRILGASVTPFLISPGSVLLGERLPVYTYTSQHGLASDSVSRVLRDSRGYLWFATRTGVSRFDGYGFTNYGTAQGLPSPWVQDLLEDRRGRYWFAMGSKGLCSWNPAESAPAKFVCYSPEQNTSVGRLYQDHSGLLWIGTSNGVFTIAEAAAAPKFNRVPLPTPAEILAIVEDQAQTMWFGTNGRGIFRRHRNGRLETFSGVAQKNAVRALLADRRGRVWAGTDYGLALLRPDAGSADFIVERTHSTARRLTDVATVHEGPDGTIWFGTSDALGKLSAGVVTTYTAANGLAQNTISSIDHDAYGNLWIGTGTGGVMKLASTGLTSFNEADGLATVRIFDLLEDRAGRVCTVAGLMRNFFLGCFDGARFEAIRPRVPRGMNYFGWGHDRIALQDRGDDWWIATGNGVLRYPPVSKLPLLARTPPKAHYRRSNGLCGDDVFRIFEDHRGDVWVSSVNDGGLARWRRQTGAFQRYCNELGQHQTPSAFAEDLAGNVWMGLYRGGLAKYDGRGFRIFPPGDAIPPGHIVSLHLDERGTLWAANMTAGLIGIENPSSSQPRFTRITAEDGLASNSVHSVISDELGRLYIGTDRGLDRMDLGTREIRHYSLDDGLPSTYVELSHRDRAGNFWFASSGGGVARLVPQPEVPRSRPRVLITRIRINGTDHPISELGAASVPALGLAAGNNNVEIHFSAVPGDPGPSSLRFEYRLEGADREWTVSGQSRSVNYASLAPGQYQFVARAAEAGSYLEAASVAFAIEPALLRRPWFLALALLAASAVAYVAHRYRLAQAVELERVRMRIATDLHDDIGSSLSQIALLSEVARRDLNGNEGALDTVSRIGEVSREVAGSISDLVWAINPQRDTLQDLTSRMRRFGNDLFESRGLTFAFSALGLSEVSSEKLKPDVRRQLYLIFKEAVTNVAKHAACTRVRVEFGVDQGRILLKVHDDGRGFTPGTGEGHGIDSMRSRTQLLGGRFDLANQEGKGTSLTISVPLHARLRESSTTPPPK